MTQSRREIIRISRRVGRELGVSKETRKLFLLGTPESSGFPLGADEIRRSLRYADEVLNHRPHSVTPSLLIMTM